MLFTFGKYILLILSTKVLEFETLITSTFFNLFKLKPLRK
jgi:hypothetical protein